MSAVCSTRVCCYEAILSKRSNRTQAQRNGSRKAIAVHQQGFQIPPVVAQRLGYRARQAILGQCEAAERRSGYTGGSPNDCGHGSRQVVAAQLQKLYTRKKAIVSGRLGAATC
jgi:hypothetical protein